MTLFLLLMSTGCFVRQTTEPGLCRAFDGPFTTRQELLVFTNDLPQIGSLGEVPAEDFSNRYFSVFHRHNEPLDTSRWAWNAFNTGGFFLEDLQPVTPLWFEMMDKEAAWDHAGDIDVPGISLVSTPLRAMPTDRFLVDDPSHPGQGFPFDLLQNSLINANEPLWLSHRSRSGEWTFVFTSYASGWARTRDTATLPEGHSLSWPLLQPIAFVEEGVPIRDSQGRFLFAGRIGMVLPSIEASPDAFKVLVATSATLDGEATFEIVTVPTRTAVAVPTPSNSRSLSRVAAGLLDLPYGWGGLFGNRDCSAVIRDLFMPFGLWLPRNSREQATIGQVTMLSELSDDHKVRVILDQAIPFATLLHKKGHIALYVGHYDGYPVVLHSVWDLVTRTQEGETRNHIGRIVLSRLRPSSEDAQCGPGTTLLADLDSMNTLTSSYRIGPLKVKQGTRALIGDPQG